MRTTLITALCFAAASAAPALGQPVFLNEIYASHSGTDNHEYIELNGTPGTLLDNVMVLIVEGDGAGAGTLDRAWDLTGLSIPLSGFFVLGDTAVVPNDFDIGASDRIENGTETFYLINATSPATVSALVGTNVSAGGGTTVIPTLGTILDLVAMVDSGFPGTDQAYDGAPVLGPDGSFFPPGIYRNADYPRNWSANFLDFNLGGAAEPFAPQTAGAINPPENPWIRISEYMYNGNGDEFIEFTNVGSLATDMTGWSFDDNSDNPGVQDLSAFGVVAPGEAVVLAEAPEVSFKADWGLAAGDKVIGGLTANLGANDRINLFAPNGYVVDRLNYGHTAFPGSYRAQDFSVWACADVLGQDDIYGFVGSIPGDVQGTVTSASGDVGSPNNHVNVSPCGRWLALGESKDTSFGETPVLIGKGTLLGGDPVQLVIKGGVPSAMCAVILGFNNASLPYGGGGILVPSPDFFGVATTDFLGGLSLTGSWPGTFPAATDFYYHVLFNDPGASANISATNAYQSTSR